MFFIRKVVIDAVMNGLKVAQKKNDKRVINPPILALHGFGQFPLLRVA